MRCVGLDLGTTFVKCITDQDTYFKFPTLHLQYNADGWDETNEETVNMVGYEALKHSKRRGGICINPITSGEPMKNTEDSLRRIIRHATTQANPNNDEICLVLGLPVNGVGALPLIRKIVKKIPNVVRDGVILQATGTYTACKLDSAHVVSIGGDTTEFLMYHKKTLISKISENMAFKYITEPRGKYAYFDLEEIQNDKSHETAKRTEQLARTIANSVYEQQKKVELKLPLVFSGGSILYAPLLAQLRKHLTDMKIVVPDDPDFVNARGMYMTAEYLSRNG